MKLVTKKDAPRRSAPLPPSSLMLISATFSDISHVVPQCDFILMGLSKDAEMEIKDRARRRKQEEREGQCFSPSLDHGPHVMSEPQGQEGTEPDFECTPRGSSPPQPSPGSRAFLLFSLSPQTPLLQQSCDLFCRGRIIYLPPPQEHCPFLTCTGPSFFLGYWRPSDQPHRESQGEYSPLPELSFLPMT